MTAIREIFLGLALLLLIGGAIGHQWVISEQASEQRAFEQQQAKLKAKVAEAGKVLGRRLNVEPFSGDVAVENLQDELEKKEPSVRSNVRIISFICIGTGIIISAGWLAALIVHYIAASLRSLKKLSICTVKCLKELCRIELIKNLTRKCTETLRKTIRRWLGKLKKQCLAILSHLEKFFISIFRQLFWLTNKLFSACLKMVRGISLSKVYSDRHQLLCDWQENKEQKIDTLYSDEKLLDPREQKNTRVDLPRLNTQILGQLEQNIRKTILDSCYKSSLEVQNSLRTQNENIEKQVAEVLQMAQSIQQSSVRSSEPVKSSIDELTRQISAIREYTTLQNKKLEKLQEGYDWNIIRNFCLRIIRCIDNLENRIAKLSRKNIDTTDLEEIMDELIFALESSGVEQFRPQVNSDYNGREKMVEVARDRIYPADPSMQGKIAEVIRPGYRYIIDEANVKVVRMAQVKLFG